jgi:hypothetical protein
MSDVSEIIECQGCSSADRARMSNNFCRTISYTLSPKVEKNRGGVPIDYSQNGKRYRYSFIIRAQVGQSWLLNESQM